MNELQVYPTAVSNMINLPPGKLTSGPNTSILSLEMRRAETANVMNGRIKILPRNKKNSRTCRQKNQSQFERIPATKTHQIFWKEKHT